MIIKYNLFIVYQLTLSNLFALKESGIIPLNSCKFVLLFKLQFFDWFILYQSLMILLTLIGFVIKKLHSPLLPTVNLQNVVEISFKFELITTKLLTNRTLVSILLT